MSGIKFEMAKDWRTPACKHDQHQGCYRCCIHCDMDVHRCGGCGEPLNHGQCVGKLGTCTDCYKLYFIDTEPS